MQMCCAVLNMISIKIWRAWHSVSVLETNTRKTSGIKTSTVDQINAVPFHLSLFIFIGNTVTLSVDSLVSNTSPLFFQEPAVESTGSSCDVLPAWRRALNAPEWPGRSREKRLTFHLCSCLMLPCLSSPLCCLVTACSQHFQVQQKSETQRGKKKEIKRARLHN